MRPVDAREAIVASVSGSRGAQPLLSWGLLAGPSPVLLPVSAAQSWLLARQEALPGTFPIK